MLAQEETVNCYFRRKGRGNEATSKHGRVRGRCRAWLLRRLKTATDSGFKEATACTYEKDECKVDLSGEERAFWLGTEAGMLGGGWAC